MQEFALSDFLFTPPYLSRFDLPNGRSVGIKANPSKTLRDVLHPVMKKNGFNLDYYNVHVVCICFVASISSMMRFK